MTDAEAEVYVAQSCLTLGKPMDYTVHGILQARILEWVAFPFFKEIFPTQGSSLGLPHCRQTVHWLSHREAQEYWSGYLSLLQQIFPTQESNQGLLHCRPIL